MKKVLFIASITGHIRAFHLPYLEYFKNCGYTVEVASNGDAEVPFCDVRHQIEFQRSCFKKDNINAYKKLKKLIDNGEYDLIHCHTPVASMMARFAARKARKKNGTKLIYTAHGFHFFKGAPIINWLVYFPVEWICSFFTDVVITINKEDFAFAKRYIHSKKVVYVPGVGLKTEKFDRAVADKEKKLRELGVPRDSIVVLSVGEINKNKNHEKVLRALADINREDVVYVVCGKGGRRGYLEKLAQDIGMKDRLIFAGHRGDLPEIYPCCDIFAFPSLREGLPVSVMEAMYTGVPVVCSNIRGNVDLIDENKGGFLFNPRCVESTKAALEKMLACTDRQNMVEYNKNKLRPFMLENVKEEMTKIYEEAWGNGYIK